MRQRSLRILNLTQTQYNWPRYAILTGRHSRNNFDIGDQNGRYAKTIEPTRAEELVLSLSEKLAVTASARTIYGEPIRAHDRIILPVARFGYGVGATSGGRDGDHVGGGSGGGGVGARPVGYIEITENGTQYVPFSTPRQILLAALAGIGLGYLLGRLRK